MDTVKCTGIKGFAIGALALVLSACGNEMMSPTITDGTVATLLSVTPAGGVAGVSASAQIVVQFDHAMPMTMQGYVTLHHGNVTDSLVACVPSWSADSMTLTLTPMAMMHAGTAYTIHVGGGMMDAVGDSVGLAMHGSGSGGRWASGDMMNGVGMMGGGGQMVGQEMGAGWAGGNGRYGMVFGFSTN